MDYGRLYDRHVADNYDEDARGLLTGVRALALAQIVSSGVARDATILDLGVGTGATLHALAPQFPHARMIGIDLSARMIEIAQTKLAFEAYVDDACNAGAHVPASSVDLALAHFLTSYVDRPRLFRVAHATLKPGALFSVVSTPHAAFGKIRHIVGSVLGAETVEAAAPAPTDAQLVAEVADAGFEVLATEIFRSPVTYGGFDEAVDWGMKSGFFAQSIDAIGLDRLTPFANLPGVFPLDDEYVGVALLARAS